MEICSSSSASPPQLFLLLLYFSFSKLQTCNWTVTTEEQISPPVVASLEHFLLILHLCECFCQPNKCFVVIFWHMTVSWTHLYSVKTRCFTYQLSLLSSSTLMFWDDIPLKKLSWSLKRETLLKFPLPSQPQAATTTRLSSQGSLEKAATFISGNTKILSLQIQIYHIRNCKIFI